MNFEDLLEQLKSNLKQAWEKFQESSFYHQLNNTYENMNPRQQKLSILGGALFIVFMLLWFPVDSLFVSQASIGEYGDQRELIRSLFKVQREASEMPSLATPPPPEALKSQIESRLQELRLIPKQIISVDTIPVSSQLIPAQFMDGGVSVTLNQLNIRQVVEIGSYLQGLSPSVKMVDLMMTAHTGDERYYDVTYKLVALKIPRYEPPVIEPEPKGKSKKPTTVEDNEG